MREILFKAKVKDWRERPKEWWWVEGYYAMMGKDDLIRHYIIQNCALAGVFKNPEMNMSFNDVEIDPETLCQYTGLIDTNSNRIWENDVIVVGKHIYIVSADEYGWNLHLIGTLPEYSHGESPFTITREVIANIFDDGWKDVVDSRLKER